MYDTQRGAALFGWALTGLGASVLDVGAAKIMAQWFHNTQFGTAATHGAALAGWRISLGFVGLVVLAPAILIYVFVIYIFVRD